MSGDLTPRKTDPLIRVAEEGVKKGYLVTGFDWYHVGAMAHIDTAGVIDARTSMKSNAFRDAREKTNPHQICTTGPGYVQIDKTAH